MLEMFNLGKLPHKKKKTTSVVRLSSSPNQAASSTRLVAAKDTAPDTSAGVPAGSDQSGDDEPHGCEQLPDPA